MLDHKSEYIRIHIRLKTNWNAANDKILTKVCPYQIFPPLIPFESILLPRSYVLLHSLCIRFTFHSMSRDSTAAVSRGLGSREAFSEAHQSMPSCVRVKESNRFTIRPLRRCCRHRKAWLLSSFRDGKW